MQLQIFPWQTVTWNWLLERYQKNRLPQALLFEGNKGIGKTTLAKVFARQLLCQSEVSLCNEEHLCRSCQLIKADTHPDFIHILPEGLSQTIKIDQVRELNEAVFKTAHFKGYRVVLIETAHRMNQAASNALLKTLEEPPAQVIFILITHSAHRISATIRSRCEKIQFAQPNMNDARSWLTSHVDSMLDEKTIDASIQLAQGSPLAARALLETDSLNWRDNILSDFSDLFLADLNPLGLSEKYKTLPLTQLLFWLKTIVVDLIRLKAGAAERMINIDKHELFSRFISQVATENLFAYLNKLYVLDNKVASGFNLNHALVVDEVFNPGLA